jgi:hypothetical protein
MRYEHTQPGYVTGPALAAGALITYFPFQDASGAVGGVGLAMTGGLLVGAVLFSSLTVTVSDEDLCFYFGPGVWTRRIPLDAIEAVESVRNSAWHGWGIRFTHHGWLYNVSGLRAVELTVRDEGRLRVGTDEPEALAAAIRAAADLDGTSRDGS